MTFEKGGYGRLLLLLLAANFAIMGVSNVYYLLAPFLTARGIADARTIGWVIGAYYAAGTLSRPLMGKVVESLSFRRSFALASLLCLAGSAGVALAGRDVVWLMLWRVLTGLGASLFLVSLTTYQSLAVPEARRGSSFSLVGVGSIAPLMTLVPLAEWFLRHDLIDAYAWISPLMALVCLLLSPCFIEPEETSGSSRAMVWGTYVELFRLPAVWALLATAFTFAFADAAVVSLAALSAERGLVASWFMGANALVAVLVRAFFHQQMDLLPRNLLACLASGMIAGALLLASLATSNFFFFVCGALFGLGMGFGFPTLLALVGDVSPVSLRPKASSAMWFCLSASYFLSPLLIGYLSLPLGVTGAFRLAAAGCCCASLLVYVLLWQKINSKRS